MTLEFNYIYLSKIIFVTWIIVLISEITASVKDSSCEVVKREEQSEKNSEAVDFTPLSIDNWDCELLDACSDKLGFEAILALHQKLDDDANGNVDISESVDFLRGELKYENGFERQKGFHRNDKQITPDELWLAWKSSEVHNWTVEETIQWLVSNVELPQYAKNFEEHEIDGTALPRLAVNTMHFLSNLGIKDPIHKQKISLKAMDVVLFGPSKNHNYFKDVILALSLIVAIGGCWFAYIQHRKAHSHMLKTMKDMDSLQHAEESLRELQKELDKAKMEQEMVVTEKKNLERRLQDEMTTIKQSQDSSFSSSDAEQTRIQQLEEELRIVLDDLRTAEKALQEKAWSPSPALQHWLQLTYELELRHYNAKKVAAEQQLAAAKEGCEKLRKKRSSFLGTFRVAHGSSIDDVDNRILQAKAALSEVTKDLQERLHRWKQIELLCGFSIVHNPGIHHLQAILETNAAQSKSAGTSRMTRTNSEGTLVDEDSSSGFPSNVSARSLANIPYGCLQRPGPSITPSEHVAAKPPDLKSCASSSAILQRADAFCYEPHSDSLSNEGMDLSSFDGGSVCDDVSICEERSVSDVTRPVFTVGASKEVLRSPLALLKRRAYDSPKSTRELPKLGQSLQEISAVSALASETGNQTEHNVISNGDKLRDIKKKVLPVMQKTKTS